MKTVSLEFTCDSDNLLTVALNQEEDEDGHLLVIGVTVGDRDTDWFGLNASEVIALRTMLETFE